jgi:putative two-component system response regulator
MLTGNSDKVTGSPQDDSFVIFNETTNFKPLLSLIRYRILVVDDDLINRTLIEALLRSQPDFDVYSVGQAWSTIQYLQAYPADVILIDTTLPDADGFALCSHIKTELGLAHIPIVLFADSVESSDRSRALEAGSEDIVTKPFQISEVMLRLRNLLRLKSLQDQVSEVEQLMYTLSNLIEARDKYTHGHAERVAILVEILGRATGLCEQEIQMLRRAAFLKDIGKAGIPDDLLNSTTAWNPDDRKSMNDRLSVPSHRSHANPTTPRLLPIIRHCHENYDGSGFPDRIAGEQIPLGSRLLSIADSYDALTSDRPFRSALNQDDAIQTLRNGSGSQWDPSFVDLFIQCITETKTSTASQFSVALIAA